MRVEWLKGMNGPRPNSATTRLITLREAHRDLDAAIEALCSHPVPDQIQLARLKKRKLRLKDEIERLRDRSVPDIIA